MTTTFNNGKIKTSLFGEIPLVEIYRDGEIGLEDATQKENAIIDAALQVSRKI